MSKPRRTRITRKPKRHGKRWIAVLVIILVIGGFVAGFVQYGLTSGAAVDFSFGTSSDVRQSYQLIALSRLSPGTIDIAHILARNTGDAGIAVVVTLRAYNAVVSAAYGGPYSEAANIQIYLPPSSGYRVVTFYLTLPVQVPTFTISVTLGRVEDFSSITSLSTSSLSPIQSISPTTLVYTQAPTNPIDYELTQQY